MHFAVCVLFFSPQAWARLSLWVYVSAGYNGGVFETTKGPKGGAYDEDKMSTRFVLGQGTVIPGLEQGILGMRTGGVRQIVVPPEVRFIVDFWVLVEK